MMLIRGLSRGNKAHGRTMKDQEVTTTTMAMREE
jgi:hypothetical protein